MLTKAIHQNYNIYKDAFSAMSGWNIDLAIKAPVVVPYHEGAIKYLKEISKWTPEFDEWNKKALAEEQQMQELWEQALNEATSSGMPAEKFGDFWMQRLGVLALK